MAIKSIQRIHPNCRQEKMVWQRLKLPVFAIDEAGRGALAGPVYASAFVLKNPFKTAVPADTIIRDSKQLSPGQREKARQWIQNNPHCQYAIGQASARTIDKVNIRQANFRAMRQALDKLSKKTGYKKYFVFVDGNDPVPKINHRQKCFIHGDANVFSIACASIMAKTSRDRYMTRLAKKWPHYNLGVHKGYGTTEHYRGIKKYGPSQIHRRTFLGK